MKLFTKLVFIGTALLLGCKPEQASKEEIERTQPNVIFIIADDLNVDLGCYGDSFIKSPHIDALAKESILFERAYCQVPLCGPSRASMLTGEQPHQKPILCNETNFREMWEGVKTFPQLLRENGYYSTRFGKIFHQRMPNKKRFVDEDDSLSWDATYNPMGSEVELYETANLFLPTTNNLNFKYAKDSLHTSPHSDELVAEKAIDFLKSDIAKEKPFFLGVGFYRPHSPYIAPSEYFDLYDLDRIVLPHDHVADTTRNPAIAFAAANRDLKFNQMSVQKKKEIIQAYYASISFMDAQVGKVIAALKEEGLYDNSLIIFTSDHGYALGEHGMWQKKTLYEKVTKVPLLVKNIDNAQRNVRKHQIVELVDIFPTITDATGITPPSYLDGTSLFSEKKNRVATSLIGRLGQGKPFKRDTINCNLFVAGYSYRNDSLRYNEWQDAQGTTELFNYVTDAEERINLSDKVDKGQINNWFKQKK